MHTRRWKFTSDP